MIDRYILQALQQATTAAVAASTLPALPIKYITAKSFPIPNDQRYLECVHTPNNINNQFWGSEKTYRGIYNLILHWNVNGGNAYDPMDLVASIAAHFAKGSVFVNAPARVQIYDVPNYGGCIPAPDGSSLMFPLNILYRSFQP